MLFDFNAATVRILISYLNDRKFIVAVSYISHQSKRSPMRWFRNSLVLSKFRSQGLDCGSCSISRKSGWRLTLEVVSSSNDLISSSCSNNFKPQRSRRGPEAAPNAVGRNSQRRSFVVSSLLLLLTVSLRSGCVWIARPRNARAFSFS